MIAGHTRQDYEGQERRKDGKHERGIVYNVQPMLMYILQRAASVPSDEVSI